MVDTTITRETRLDPPFAAVPLGADGKAFSSHWDGWITALTDRVQLMWQKFGQGVTDGSDAVAGDVGEYISASAATSSVGLGFNAATDVAHIDLTAGDWDVAGAVHFTSSGGNMAIIAGWVSDASGAEPAQPSPGYASMRHTTNGFYATQTVLALSPRRFSTASPVTVYLGALATFASGVVAAGGFIGARRMR